MTTISRARFEYICRAMADRMAAGPQPINRANEVHVGKRVEVTAEEKAFLQKSQATAAAAEADAEALRREFGPRAETAFSPDNATYTKWGKISTEEEKAAYVQWKLDQFDKAEAFAEKRKQEIEKSGSSAPTTAQSGNASPAGSSEVKHFRYEESHEMYLPNISDLSLEHSKKALFFVESAIKNHEDVGRTVHGHYGKQPISDLKTYLAALKDHLSKIDTGGSLTPSESVKGATSTNG